MDFGARARWDSAQSTKRFVQNGIEFLPKDAAAAQLGVSISTLLRQGLTKYYPLGDGPTKPVYFKRVDVEALAEKRQSDAS